MEGTENNMSLFDMDGLELNMDGSFAEETSTPETPPSEGGDDDITAGLDTEAPAEENLNEDESPEVVVEEDDSTSEGEGADDASPNLYSSFANVLSEQGLLPSLNLDETKVESIDDLTAALKTQIDSQVKNYLLSKVGEEGYEALEKGVSLADYQAHQNNVQSLDNITTDSLSEDIELSKNLIYQDLINQGISEVKAQRILKRTIDLGEEAILEDAAESLESLKAFEAQRLEQIKQDNIAREAQLQQEQERIDNDLKNNIYGSDELIKGIKVSKAMQDKVYESITKIVNQTEDGVAENKLMQTRRQDPISFDTKLYYLFELTNGFTDFSKVVTKSKSTATQDLEKAMRQNRFEGSGNPSFVDDPQSYGGFGAELNL